MDEPIPANEFSRFVVLDDGRARVLRFAIEATPTECAALAKRFGLGRLERLAAEGECAPRAGGTWRLTAALAAAVVQTCVVTLEPVAAEIADRFELHFAPIAEADPAVELDIQGEDCEPMPIDGKLDVGEIVAQQLSLALDPFPRRPGASWNAADATGTAAAEARRSPFAALADRLGKPRIP